MPRDAYLESRVLTADPVELIHMLYEHALMQVRSARAALITDDIVTRSQAIAKALAIIGELEGSLDHKAGGSISQNLARLYQYMRKRLIEANLRREDKALAEVESLMKTLDEAWSAMRHATSMPSPGAYAVAAVSEMAHSWSA